MNTDTSAISCLLHTQEAHGSSPCAPTNTQPASSPARQRKHKTTAEVHAERLSAFRRRLAREKAQNAQVFGPYTGPIGPLATTIRLTRGHVALIDVEDYERVTAIKWRAKVQKDGRVYGIAHEPGSGHRGRTLQMHRFIIDAKASEKVDHRDGNGLNNTKENLRPCTTAQNCCNQRPHANKGTAFKGVYFCKTRKRFRAQIMVNYKKFNLGEFADEKSAALAYDAAARRLHGEFARCNFPEPAAAQGGAR